MLERREKEVVEPKGVEPLYEDFLPRNATSLVR